MELTEFLLARIAEDEAAAQTSGPWLRGPDAYDDDMLWAGAAPGWLSPIPFLRPRDVGRHFEHIARHDPTRVLAECQAKRRIIEAVKEHEEGEWEDDPIHGAVLRPLALPYADHPDYRQEWKP